MTGLKTATSEILKSRSADLAVGKPSSHFGDFKRIDSGLFELRFFFGSGLRIYYTIQNGRVVVLLAGGDKSTQTKDIEKATTLLNELED